MSNEEDMRNSNFSDWTEEKKKIQSWKSWNNQRNENRNERHRCDREGMVVE